ncbi:tripartite tricarboxylate transporter TctB family protein [Fictibacillus sp. Mic-4]|uniref:tripartite tricarboxylate transporter TctB family protein n=1 Tax=Fictibacillus sp. Mic-4 TaxID=3132826 RepID=UPI003CF2D3B2
MSKTFDRYASFIFFIVGMAFMIESGRISHSAYGSNVGPNVFPFLLGLILGLLSIKLLIETMKYQNERKEKEALDYKKFLIILVAAILYALLLEPFGYIISTFLFLLVGFQTMEKGGWVKTVLISASFSFGVYYLFAEVLKGTLPGLPAWFSS